MKPESTISQSSFATSFCSRSVPAMIAQRRMLELRSRNPSFQAHVDFELTR
jgi:hypothetical protein